MANKTAEIKHLAQRALSIIPNHRDMDIIERVFLEIERNPDLYKDYLDLQKHFSKNTLNVWIGKYTKGITGMERGPRVKAKRSPLIASYTKLL